MGYANNRTTRQTIASGGLAVYPGERRNRRVSAKGATHHMDAERFEDGRDVKGRFAAGAASVGTDDEPAIRLDCAVHQADNVLAEARFGHAVGRV